MSDRQRAAPAAPARAAPAPAPIHHQALRFVVIGGTTTLIDALCWSLLLHLGVAAAVAKGVSYATGMIVGFVGNRFWTFREASTGGVGWSAPLRFALLYLVSLALNIAVLSAVLAAATTAGAGELAARALAFVTATAASTVVNFIGSRQLVFRPSRTASRP